MEQKIDAEDKLEIVNGKGQRVSWAFYTTTHSHYLRVVECTALEPSGKLQPNANVVFFHEMAFLRRVIASCP